MDFFTSQDLARRNTKLLVVYFIAAVLGIIATLYLAVWGALLWAGDGRGPRPFQPELLVAVAGLTLVIIALGSLYKTWELRRGGDFVAQMLGGRRLPSSTTNLAERRLLNIVEEMALAAGIPAPPVYVLDREKSINAFAAGFTPADAVIGVNRGTLDYLSRDELQGVIAHEFSHILNGDMRMNLRLIGVLHGILLISIIGYYMMRIRSSGRDNKGAGWIVMVGLAAYVVGSIGLLFGRLIKAAISRQREYLADASAVQFTRNPPGIAGALKKIGGLAEGSKIQHPEAETASHLFFSSTLSSFMIGLLSTHPPLDERIRRVDPAFEGKFPRTQALPPDEELEAAGVAQLAAPAGPATPRASATKKVRLNPEQALQSIGSLTPAQMVIAAELVAQLPAPLREAIREPFSARAVLFAMLLDEDLQIRERQVNIIVQREGQPSATEAQRLRPVLNSAGVSARLPVMEILQGTLRSLSPDQYKRLRETVQSLVVADEKTSMFEFVLQRMLLSHLDRHYLITAPPKIKFHSLSGTIVESASDLLAVLAHAGSRSQPEAEAAYQMGRAELRAGREELLERERCTLGLVDAALARLEGGAPQVKKRVLAALFKTAASDEQIMVQEAELLRAFADAMDCPLPPQHSGSADAPE